MNARELALSFDHKDSKVLADPAGFWSVLREEAPVAWSDRYGGFWILSRYQDVAAASRDTETFSSAGGVFMPPIRPALLPFELDPPEHTAYRKAVQRFLLPSAVASLEPAMRDLARRLLGGVLGQRHADLGGDYVMAFVVEIFCNLFGVPAPEREPVLSWARHVLEDRVEDPDEAARAAEALTGYLSSLVERSSGEGDLVGDLVTAWSELPGGGRERLVRACFTLVLAGLETTVIAATNMIVLLGRDRDAWERLAAEPATLPLAVAEVLRCDPPAQGHFRTLTRDVEMHGCKMAVGDKVFLAWGGANLDEREFEAAGSWRLDRRPNRHLAFGNGPHRCVGAPLAELELRVMIGELVTSGARYSIEEDALLRFPTTRGYLRLPVTFDV